MNLVGGVNTQPSGMCQLCRMSSTLPPTVLNITYLVPMYRTEEQISILPTYS